MLGNMSGSPSAVNHVAQPAMLRYQPIMPDEPKDQRVPVMMSVSELKRLDAWRRETEDLPSRGEAIRRLIEAGLKATSDGK